jgi:hypothetical protein
MKTLYHPANALEAHMLVHLLQQEGLSPEIQGEHLQGAIGELPAAGLLRLVVPPEQYDAGRSAIARWEAAQPVESTPGVAAHQARRRGGWYFLAGLLAGAGVMYAMVRTPVGADGIDHDRDGLLDEKYTFSPRGTVVRYEADRDLDKRVDHVIEYDDRGFPATGRSDEDFDGHFESLLTFRRGQVETVQSDTDGDGFPDATSFYESGVLRKVTYRDPKTGQPLRIEHFRIGQLLHADIDTDGDGQLDTRARYSPLGEVLSRGPL